MPDFEGQQSMDLGRVISWSANGFWTPEGQWELMVVGRREFCTWAESTPEFYAELTTAEMLDALLGDLWGRLEVVKR